MLLLVFFNLLHQSSSNVIDVVCKSTADYKLCTESFRSNPRSANANAKGLARIMLHLLLYKITHNIVYIRRQMIEKKFEMIYPISNQCLQVCYKNYNFILHHFILNAIKYLDLNKYHDATFAIGLSGRNVSTCADGCVKYPSFNLTKRSNDYAYFVQVVGDVIDFLK